MPSGRQVSDHFRYTQGTVTIRSTNDVGVALEEQNDMPVNPVIPFTGWIGRVPKIICLFGGSTPVKNVFEKWLG